MTGISCSVLREGSRLVVVVYHVSAVVVALHSGRALASVDGVMVAPVEDDIIDEFRIHMTVVNTGANTVETW